MTDPRSPHDPVARYYAALSHETEPARRVSWRGPWDQQLRFEVLCAVLQGAPTAPLPTVLDVGCGLGDLAPFLERRGQPVAYLGVDVLPEMIAGARQRHPQRRFELLDVLASDPPGAPFDYVFASGTLSVRGPGHQDHVRRMIERMFALCTRGLALNFQSARVRGRHAPGELDRDIFYADPLETYTFCRTLTPRTVLREDVLPTDFSVLLFRGPSGAHLGYEQLVRREPPVPGWHAGLASLCLDQGLPDEALRCLQGAPDSAEVANFRGVSWLHAGDPLRAVESLRRALVLDPMAPEPPVNLGVALSMLGRGDEAAAVWEQALRRRPDNDLARSRLAAWALERGDGARVESLAAGLHDPVERALLRGLAAAQQGHLRQASEHLEVAAAQDPNHARARLELADVCARLGEEARAACRYLEVLERVPDHRAARRALRALVLRRRGQGATAGAELREELLRWRARGSGDHVAGLLAQLDR